MWNPYFAVTESGVPTVSERTSTAPAHCNHNHIIRGPRQASEDVGQGEPPTCVSSYIPLSMKPEKASLPGNYVRTALLSCCLLVFALALVMFGTRRSSFLQPLALQATKVATHIKHSQYRDTRVQRGTPAPDLQRLQQQRKWSFGDSVDNGADAPAGEDQPAESAGLSEGAGSGENSGGEALLLETSEHWRQKKQWSETGDFFSDLTLVGAEAEAIQDHDDRRCQVAGNKKFDATACLGAPYLYVSFHGGSTPDRVRNVCKFTRDGCSMGSVLLPSSIYRPRSLRGLLLHENFLFVAEAWRRDSRVLRFSHCNPALGHRRELLQQLVTGSEENPESGLIHPYSFAQRADDPHIYVSVQETGSVLRFHHASGKPGPLAPALKRRMEKDGDTAQSYVNGSFILLEPNEEIRGIAFDQQGLLYVANKQRGVLVFDKEGSFVGELPLHISKPISIYYCRDRASLWIGSAKSHTLYEVDASTWEVMQTIKHDHLIHPAGFATYGDDLFVLSQDKDKLLRFSMSSGELMEVVLDEVQDYGERLILSPC